jgi:hypothetical protein
MNNPEENEERVPLGGESKKKALRKKRKTYLVYGLMFRV